MNPIAAVFLLLGAFVFVLSGIGLMRFSTPYARFHAAGKASPVAFLLVAVGAAVEIGGSGAVELVVAGAALVLTLPIGVHLLFRAVHRTTAPTLGIDELAPVERAARERMGHKGEIEGDDGSSD